VGTSRATLINGCNVVSQIIMNLPSSGTLIVSGAVAYNYYASTWLSFRVSNDYTCGVGTDPANGQTHAITGTNGWTGGTVPIVGVFGIDGPMTFTVTLGALKGGTVGSGETVEGSRMVATFYPN
jgi:hypothetical protein